ncbi:hypothetical protein ACET3Z_010617 [Daucus carota]
MARQSDTVQNFSSSSDSNLQKPAESPASRKLGKHSNELIKSSADAPHVSPSEEPTIKAQQVHSNKEIYMKKPLLHHRSGAKSVAGGGVILGSLATTFSIAILLYIRATRRNSANQTPGIP